MKHFEKQYDFKVKYKFRTFEEGGRKTPVHQGIRTDFWYHHEENTETDLFMIWPAFENEEGELIETGQVDNEGIARMRIVSEKMTQYHKGKIKVGIKGYFMEGARKTANCEVIEIGERLTQ